jgi:hypothetical protein
MLAGLAERQPFHLIDRLNALEFLQNSAYCSRASYVAGTRDHDHAPAWLHSPKDQIGGVAR